MTLSKAPPLPRRSKIALLVLAGVTLSSTAAGFYFSNSARSSYKPLVLANLLVLAVIALTVVLMKTVERRTNISVYSSVLFSLSKDDRKAVSKAVNRGRAVQDIRLAPVALEYAIEFRKKSLFFIILWLLLVAFQILDLLTEQSKGLHLGALTCYSSGVIMFIVLRVQAQRSQANNQRLLAGRS